MLIECVLQDELSKDELNALLEDTAQIKNLTKSNILLERNIVRLDKFAKLNRAQKIATFTIARERKDPKFKKLITIWKIERYLEDYLMKRYGNEAMRRAKASMNKAKTSTSATVKKVVNNVHKQLNSPI